MAHPIGKRRSSGSVVAVRAANTSLTDLFGISPIIACALVGYTGDVLRFRNCDQFAAYNGTAPVEFSSGGRTVSTVPARQPQAEPRPPPRRRLPDPPTPSEGRAYFDRKVAEGETKKEVLRALKRHVGNAVFHQLLADAARAGR